MHRRQVTLGLLVVLTGGACAAVAAAVAVIARAERRTNGQPAQTAPPSIAAAGPSTGAVALPHASLGPYGTFEAAGQPAWGLSQAPELVEQYGNGRDSVLVLRCNCGKIIRLLDHNVAADGTVSPSLWHDVPGCGWHVMGRLEGWERGEWHAGGAAPQ